MDRRILVVDHEPVYDLVKLLILEGFEVVGSAYDGEKAIELAYEKRPNLILMNSELPRLSGLKASRIIHKAYRIPSILMAASTPEEMKNDHVIGYINKPICAEAIIPELEKALQQAKKQRLYEEKIKVSNISLQQRKSIEKAKGIIMRKRKIPEEKAYRLLRNLSSDKHLPIAKIAELIISRDESAMMNK